MLCVFILPGIPSCSRLLHWWDLRSRGQPTSGTSQASLSLTKYWLLGVNSGRKSKSLILTKSVLCSPSTPTHAHRVSMSHTEIFTTPTPPYPTPPSCHLSFLLNPGWVSHCQFLIILCPLLILFFNFSHS